jgi:hypothetical protein
MPHPPALHTAATSSGVLIQLIPGSITGYLMPKSLVILVFIVHLLQKFVYLADAPHSLYLRRIFFTPAMSLPPGTGPKPYLNTDRWIKLYNF